MSAKSRKVPRPTLPLVLNVLSENGIIFILIGLFLRSKIMLISQKRVFYKRGTRINMGNIYYFTSVCCMVQLIYTIIQSKNSTAVKKLYESLKIFDFYFPW